MSVKGVIRVVALGGLIAAAATLVPARAEAQSRFGLGLWAGMFSPLGSSPTATSAVNSIDRKNSFAGGARLTYWGSNVLGLEAVAGLTPAKVAVAGASVNGTRSLNVFAGGVKLMVGLSPSLSPVGFHIGAGPAIIRRGKDVASQTNSETNLGGVFGAGLRFPISSGLGLRFDVEDYLYEGTIGGVKKTRNDLVTSAGLNIGF
jgi:hypothetical protein